ncbi:MAG: hypothetical protein IJO13_11265 [Lachnospiraceae bacterium]|nr:hypothetical protein [Lachnospiraceae bacterium]
MKAYEYMKDDFTADGTDLKELYELAELIDANTDTKMCNFNECEILHYSGRNHNTLYFIAINPRQPFSIKSNKDGETVAGLLRNKRMSVYGFAKYRVINIIDDFSHDKNRTVFELATSFDNDPHPYLYTSQVANKTMLPRLTNNQFRDSCSSLGRDIYLAERIGAAPGTISPYVTYRFSGPIKKAMGFFARDPKRISFRDVVIAADTYTRKSKCIHWEFTNKDGLEAVFIYPDFAKKIEKEFPDIKYQPVIIIAACDTGYAADRVITGWIDKKRSTYTAFYTSEKILLSSENVIRSYQDTIEECMDRFYEDAEKMANMQKEYLITSVHPFKDTISDVSKKCIEDSSAGSKAEKVFFDYAEKATNLNTKYDLIELLLDISEVGQFEKMSPFACSQIRKEGIRRLFLS